MTRRSFLGLPALALIPQGEPAYCEVVQVKREDSFDFSGLQFFHLTDPQGTWSVTADGDLAVSQRLRQLEGQKVRVTLELVQLERISR